MRLYLAGPMSFYADHNIPAFHAAAARLRADGYEVVSPAETEGESQEDRSWAEWMRRDIKLLVECDAVACLPGWQYSRGATLETDIARHLGMALYCAETMAPLGETRGCVRGPLEALLAKVIVWADATFPASTPASKAAHLLDEARELAADPTDGQEMADVVILVAHLAAGCGIDLYAEIEKKHERNRLRTWGKPDARGVVRHVEPEVARV